MTYLQTYRSQTMSKSDIVRQIAEEQGIELIDLPLSKSTTDCNQAVTFNNQQEYDNATEPSLSDHQDEPACAEFAEYVTRELLAGRDWQNLSSELLIFDLAYLGGGYQMALEWVCEELTEKQYLEYLEKLNED